MGSSHFIKSNSLTTFIKTTKGGQLMFIKMFEFFRRRKLAKKEKREGSSPIRKQAISKLRKLHGKMKEGTKRIL